MFRRITALCNRRTFIPTIYVNVMIYYDYMKFLNCSLCVQAVRRASAGHRLALHRSHSGLRLEPVTLLKRHSEETRGCFHMCDRWEVLHFCHRPVFFLRRGSAKQKSWLSEVCSWFFPSGKWVWWDKMHHVTDDCSSDKKALGYSYNPDIKRLRWCDRRRKHHYTTS